MSNANGWTWTMRIHFLLAERLHWILAAAFLWQALPLLTSAFLLPSRPRPVAPGQGNMAQDLSTLREISQGFRHH